MQRLATLFPPDEREMALGLGVALTDRLIATVRHILLDPVGGSGTAIFHYKRSQKEFTFRSLSIALGLEEHRDVQELAADEDLAILVTEVSMGFNKVSRLAAPPPPADSPLKFAKNRGKDGKGLDRKTVPGTYTCSVGPSVGYYEPTSQFLGDGVSGSPIWAEDGSVLALLKNAGNKTGLAVRLESAFELVAGYLCCGDLTELPERADELGLRMAGGSDWSSVLNSFTGRPPQPVITRLVQRAIESQTRIAPLVDGVAIEWLDKTLEENGLRAIELQSFLGWNREPYNALKASDVQAGPLQEMIDHGVLVADAGFVEPFHRSLDLQWPPAARTIGIPIVAEARQANDENEVVPTWFSGARAYGTDEGYVDGLKRPRLWAAYDTKPHLSAAHASFVATAQSSSVDVFELRDVTKNFVYDAGAPVTGLYDTNAGFRIETATGCVYLDVEHLVRNGNQQSEAKRDGPRTYALRGPAHWGSIPIEQPQALFDVTLIDPSEADEPRYIVGDHKGRLSLSIVGDAVAAIGLDDRVMLRAAGADRTTSVAGAIQVALGHDRTVLILTAEPSFHIWRPFTTERHPRRLCRVDGVTEIAGCADGWLVAFRGERSVMFAATENNLTHWATGPRVYLESFEAAWPIDRNRFVVSYGDAQEEYPWNQS